MSDFFAVAQKRRSIRKFTDEAVPESVMQAAFDAAIIAPNSSNTQTWDFFWVQSEEKKKLLVEACLSQSAARTAQELVVVVADPKLWLRSRQPLIDFIRTLKVPKAVTDYYEKHTAIFYRWGFLNLYAPFKWLVFNVAGIFKPTPRSPIGLGDLQMISVKSAALACENFVLAISAQGFATCMMEGFDERRVRKLLGLKSSSAKVVMVIGIGREGERGTWGPRFRIHPSEVVHRV
jgi:nitroreductase